MPLAAADDVHRLTRGFKMRVWFHSDRISARRGDTVTLRGSVQNGFPDAVTVSYAVDADPRLGWSVLAATSVEEHATVPFTVEVQVPRDLPASHASVSVELIVEIAQTDLQARARTVIDLVAEPRGCAAFTAAPSVKLNADGTATLHAAIANCGPFDLSVDLRVRHVEGWMFDVDTSEVTLSAGAGPVDVSAVVGRPGTVRIDVGDTLQVEVTADGEVLTTATLSVRPGTDGPRQRARRLLGSGVVAVVMVLALAMLGPRLLADEPVAEEVPPPDATEVEPPPEPAPAPPPAPAPEPAPPPPPAPAPAPPPPPQPPRPEPPRPEPPTPEPPVPAPSIDSFVARFEVEGCAVVLEWETSDDRGVRLVRTLFDEQTEIGLEPDADAAVDPLLDMLRALEVEQGTVRYELSALGADPAATATAIQDVAFSCVREQPDLVVMPEVTPRQVDDLNWVVDAAIANVGTAPSAAFSVGVADVSGTVVEPAAINVPVRGLAPGETEPITFACLSSSIRITADVGDVVEESDEENNSHVTQVCPVGG